MMGWLSRILKGSSSSSSSPTSKRKSRCTCGDRDQSSTVDTNHSEDGYGSPQNSEKEDINCSITSSLSEASSENVLDENEETVEHGEMEEDEGLSLALQRSLNLESWHNPYDIASIFEPYPFLNSGCRNCELCHGEIDGWQCSKCMDAFPECIQDQTINLPFAYYEGNYSLPQSLPQTYYNIHPRLICDVCRKQVTVSGNSQYKITPIWGQTYCTKHDRDGTARCFCCKRLEPFGTKYSLRSDAERICSDCQKSVITNRHEFQLLIEEIQRFYEELDMKVYDQFPFELAAPEDMNADGSGKILGLTKPDESALWTTISRPVFGPGNKLIKIVTEQHKLVSYKEVKKVQVLRDCPRLYTGSTLAHEMMHAWLHLHGSYLNIRGRWKELGYMGSESEKLHEGLCEVMAHMWLESEIHAMSGSEYSSSTQLNFERKLAHHLKRHQIEENPDPTYGGGFRLVRPVVTKYGLKGTLDYIRMTGRFPE